MTLTDLSSSVRKYTPHTIIGILVFLIVYYAVQLSFLLARSDDKPILVINPIFNQIKKPYLSEASSSAGLKFTLDTVEGRPVTATDTAKVFFLPTPRTRFGYRQKIFLMAKQAGINTETAKYRLLGSQAVFSDERQKFVVDINNFNFTYEYFFDKEPQLFQNSNKPTAQQSETVANNFLNSIGRYPQELSQGKTNTIFIQYQPHNNSIRVLDKNLEANMAEVDFYRPDIDGTPIVSPKYFNSPNYVLITFQNDKAPKILRAQIRFFEKSEAQVGMYPLRSAEDAFNILKSGKGWAISNPKNVTNVIIRKTFVGYYDPDIYQEFMQPVYVYLGDDNFVGYVSAVHSQYLIE